MKIAVVVQRYGEEVSGGAELHARWLAEQLNAEHEVSVITSCALDYTSWANHYSAGETQINHVPVYRFPVDHTRDWSQSQQSARTILLTPHTLHDEINWMKMQGPYSSLLLDYLGQVYEQFDFFIFFTYLYATTYFGLPLVSDKAILVPTAHEEPYLNLPLFRSLFHLPRAIVYNTETERGLVHSVMQNQRVVSIVAGTGINLPANSDPTQFRQKFNLQDDYLLYVGRVSASKNIPELVDYFVRLQQETNASLKLLIAGKPTINLPTHPNIIYTGYISEQEKFDAITGAKAIVVPSLYESLSMLLLEGWLMGKPAIVHGKCGVTKGLCRQANGGLYYSSYDEFLAVVQKLMSESALCRQLGESGRNFAQNRYHWDVIMAKYRALFDSL